MTRMTKRPFLLLAMLLLGAGVVQAGVIALAPPADSCPANCGACGPIGE